MRFREHIQTAGTALKRWFIAQSYDALAVGILWLMGLWLLRVPWPTFWAFLGALLQYIPNFGPVLTLIGPAMSAALTGGFDRFVYVLGLYAIIVAVDGFVLQPLLMKRAASVPVWASLLAPVILGLFLSFWGVLLAAPLLAIIYTFRERSRARQTDRV